nr:hypothetical protein [Tanacetum cinerariifolium]
MVLWIKEKKEDASCAAHISLGIICLLQKCPTITWMPYKNMETHKRITTSKGNTRYVLLLLDIGIDPNTR